MSKRLTRTREVATASEARARLFSETLAETRASIGRDPARTSQCLDRLESLLVQSGLLATTDEPPAFRSGGLAQWQASRVQRYIEQSLDRRLSTAALAEVVSLSEYHFSRAFRVSFGRPPHAYVVEQRIRLAKRLMLASDAPLSQIAVACGMADQAHLCRVFRRLVGASPSQWRRLHGAAGRET